MNYSSCTSQIVAISRSEDFLRLFFPHIIIFCEGTRENVDAFSDDKCNEESCNSYIIIGILLLLLGGGGFAR